MRETMTTPLIHIIKAADQLREKGLEFIQEHYGLAFGTTPPDEPDHLFVACTNIGLREPTIIGTIGISVWKPTEPIRLARIYDFDWELAPRPILPESIFEYGRLIATRPGISKALIAAASQYALYIGRTSGWCEHTDAVHRICLSFGLSFISVEAPLRENLVAEGDKEFYRSNPSVKLYMTDAKEWVSTLAGSVICENEMWTIP
jgi:hypothetical protein